MLFLGENSETLVTIFIITIIVAKISFKRQSDKMTMMMFFNRRRQLTRGLTQSSEEKPLGRSTSSQLTILCPHTMCAHSMYAHTDQRHNHINHKKSNIKDQLCVLHRRVPIYWQRRQAPRTGDQELGKNKSEPRFLLYKEAIIKFLRAGTQRRSCSRLFWGWSGSTRSRLSRWEKTRTRLFSRWAVFKPQSTQNFNPLSDVSGTLCLKGGCKSRK